MSAPDPEWVEAGARASAQWHRNEDAWDSDDRALAYLILTAALPLIREQIAAEIEAQATTQECISLRTTGPALPPDIDCGCWVCADQRLVGKFAAIARGGAQ